MRDIVQKKLDSYNARTVQDEENALKEITQEVALYAVSKSGFLERAFFQGGTCLRIIHGNDRFSEDLDFALEKPQMDFNLQPYLEKTAELMRPYGYEVEISGSDKPDKNVKMRFLKDESIKKIISFTHLSDLRKKINIKIELDVNPPEGAEVETKFMDFPTDFAVAVHDRRTLFSGKIHALLCRSYVKGRDWYDFSWNVSQKNTINYKMLESALFLDGPWKAIKLPVGEQWLKKELQKKINEIDWIKAHKDVAPFLRPEKRGDLEKLWSKIFFSDKLEKLIP